MRSRAVGERYHEAMDATGTSDAVRTLVEAGCLGGDPLPWLLASPEPYARWATLTQVVGMPHDDSAVTAARTQLLADDNVAALISALPTRFTGLSADHHNPQFLPNRLNLLADMGLTRGDSERVDALLDLLVGTQDRGGRFSGRTTGHRAGSASDRCDDNAVVEVLVRFGMQADPRVERALARLAADTSSTLQGRGWSCTAAHKPLTRVLSRRLDACPQITLEGLRCMASLPAQKRQRAAVDAARTPLEVWRRRPQERPHQFGHGYQFKTVRWPSVWYDVLAVLDTVGRFPELWRAPDARPEDRAAVAELAACLIAYNVDGDGRVTPRRVHKGYEQFSFGQKTAPSAFATAKVLAALTRVADLAEDIAAVDVEALASSKGGSGRAIPPEQRSAMPEACPMPAIHIYDPARILPRVLTRHHLDRPWEEQTPESITADIVGLVATDPVTPYRTLAARMPGFNPLALEQAIDHRHSLVRWRGMRGVLQAFRRDFVPVVHAATSPQVVRYARTHAANRGIPPRMYDAWAPRVLEACGPDSVTLAEMRARLHPDLDLGAVVGLMTAEGLLVRAQPDRGATDHRMRFAATASILPGVELDRISQDDARAQILRAYVRGYGPVTLRDAAWWTGMDLKRVSRAMESLEDELVEIGLKGREGAWLMHAADAEELERAALLDQPSVSALPANDPLVTGYADRSRFIDDIARPYVFDTATNAAPVVLVNGRIVAVWDINTQPARPHCAGERTVLVFAVAPLDAEAIALIDTELLAVANVVGAPATCVRHVTGMRPLASRQVGSFTHPLR